MALMPPVLQQIAEIAGPLAAVRIARELGGRRIYVAPRPGPKNPLTRLLGRPLAMAIAEGLGSGDLEVPSARPLLNWYAARHLRREGWTTRMIAKRLNLTERRIRQLVTGVEPGHLPKGIPEPNPLICPLCGQCRDSAIDTGNLPHDDPDDYLIDDLRPEEFVGHIDPIDDSAVHDPIRLGLLSQAAAARESTSLSPSARSTETSCDTPGSAIVTP